jgi:hypothetical protein
MKVERGLSLLTLGHESTTDLTTEKIVIEATRTQNSNQDKMMNYQQANPPTNDEVNLNAIVNAEVEDEAGDESLAAVRA